MSNVLRRRMFTLPKYEHQSTGIASGLEYRPGYRVGGRVSFNGGGGASYTLPFDPLPGMDDIPPIKPRLKRGSGPTTRGRPGPVTNENKNMTLAEEAMQTKAVTNRSNVTEAAPVSADLQSNVGLSSLDKDREFIDRQKQIENLLTQATEEIDYEKYAPTTGEIVGGGLTEAYDKLYGQPIEAGTLGKPSVVGTVVNEIAKQANAAVATQKELELLGETEKKSDKKAATEKALDLANSVYGTDVAAFTEQQKNELMQVLGVNELLFNQWAKQGDLALANLVSMRQSDLGYATLDNQMQIALKNADIDIDIANIQAMAPTAEMKNFGSLLEAKNADGTPMFTTAEAIAKAFSEVNSQLDFGAALMSALSSGQLVADPTQSVLQAFQIMQSMFGDSMNINLEDLEKMLETSGDINGDIGTFEKQFGE